MSRRFDQRPPQPRRSVAGNAPVVHVVGTALDARDQPRIARQRRPAGEATDVAHLGANRQRHHGPDANEPVQRDRDGVRRGAVFDLGIGRVGVGMDGAIEALEAAQRPVGVGPQLRHLGEPRERPRCIELGPGRLAGIIAQQERADHLRQARPQPH